MEECPECRSTKLARGFEGVLCGQCGLVIEDKAMFSGKMLV